MNLVGFGEIEKVHPATRLPYPQVGQGEPSIGPFLCLFRSLLQQRISRVVRMHIKNLEGYNACSLYESSC